MPAMVLEGTTSPFLPRCADRRALKRGNVLARLSRGSPSSSDPSRSSCVRLRSYRRGFSRSSLYSGSCEASKTSARGETRIQPAANLYKACHLPLALPGLTVVKSPKEPQNALREKGIDSSDAWSTDVGSETESPKTTSGAAGAANCPPPGESPVWVASVNGDIIREQRKTAAAMLEKVPIERTCDGLSGAHGANEDPSEVFRHPDSPNCPFKVLCRVLPKIRNVALKRQKRYASVCHVSLPDGPSVEIGEDFAGSQHMTKRTGPSCVSKFTSSHRETPVSGPSRKDSGYSSKGSKSPITTISSPSRENGSSQNTFLIVRTNTCSSTSLMEVPPSRSDSLRSLRSLASFRGDISPDVPPDLRARYALRKYITHEMTVKEGNYAKNLRELAEVFQGPLAQASARAAATVMRQQSSRKSALKCPGECASRCLCKYLHIGCNPTSPEVPGSSRYLAVNSSPRLKKPCFGCKGNPSTMPSTLSSVGLGLKNPRAMPEWVNELYATSTTIADDLKMVYHNWTPGKTGVGDVFLKNLQFDRFAVYLRYCRDYKSVIDAVGRLSKSSFILKTMGANPEKNRLAFKSYLILPIQQLGRYPLWLHDLVKATPEDHPDYLGLVEAERQMRELASVANSWVDGGVRK